MYIERIQSPYDVKRMPKEARVLLCKEIRETLLTKLSKNGGHYGPNLGVVELTVALHTVFESPHDKIVFDVSHQSYTHKILTGRKQAFLDEAQYQAVSGYTNPEESDHDFFNIGHTSTSISLACGLAKARDLKNEKANVIAVIGDGSLSGGQAYEGLNNAVELGTNMIVIVNDNEMSIAENRGGLYQNLKVLRDSNGQSELNFFKALGFDYVYIEAGNDVDVLIDALSKVKDCEHPIVVHIKTEKGHGYDYATQDKEIWHAGGPFDLETGVRRVRSHEDYSSLTGAFLLDKMKKDRKVVTITSGTPGIVGFDAAQRAQMSDQFIDVGIAEEYAVSFASGIAKGGGTAVYPVFSTFLQRSYDQLSQDLCINHNPATLIVFGASVYGMNDVTHLGIFDIAMMSNIPNLVYLAPTSVEEYFAMLDWSMSQTNDPVAVRVPGGDLVSSKKDVDRDYSQLNRYQVTQAGEAVAILGLGGFYTLAEKISEELMKRHNIQATLVNPRFITGIDDGLLDNLKQNHRLVITLEDGILDGGFGEKISRYYGLSSMRVKNYGLEKSFPDRYRPEVLLSQQGITVDKIIKDIENNLEIKD